MPDSPFKDRPFDVHLQKDNPYIEISFNTSMVKYQNAEPVKGTRMRFIIDDRRNRPDPGFGFYLELVNAPNPSPKILGEINGGRVIPPKQIDRLGIPREWVENILPAWCGEPVRVEAFGKSSVKVTPNGFFRMLALASLIYNHQMKVSASLEVVQLHFRKKGLERFTFSFSLQDIKGREKYLQKS